ncbi:MAG: energy transducer TonB [Flavobacteriales bacterium]|nr:energy transducer TonB [Flavobacteriales bacterium]
MDEQRHIDDVIFHGRNKEYGAYQLRQRQAKHSLIGFAISAFLIAFFFSAPLLIDIIFKKEEEALKIEAKRTLKYSELSAPPPIEVEKPPEPIKVPPKEIKSVKYLPPVAKPDEEVPDDEEVPTIDELDEAAPSTETIDVPDSVIFDETDVAVVEELPDEPFTVVETMPLFPGGDTELLRYISSNISYPSTAKELRIQGRVYVSFVVEKDGSVTNVEVIRGIGGGLDEEAVRVIESMPQWSPGMQGGMLVRVRFVQQITFVLK